MSMSYLYFVMNMIRRDLPSLKLLNLVYDLTPVKYVRIVITEVAIPCLSCTYACVHSPLSLSLSLSLITFRSCIGWYDTSYLCSRHYKRVSKRSRVTLPRSSLYVKYM